MPEPIAIATLLAPAVKRTVDKLAQGLLSAGERLARSLTDQAKVELRVGFTNYFSVSYEKCRHYKSLLNPNQPLEVLTNYVHVTLHLGARNLTDDELIQSLPELRYTVIMGLAGSGKSMLMKYLTMTYFEGHGDLAPLFVELRHLNNLSQPDLLAYIRTSATGKTSGITQEQFELSLSSGTLLLVLDGFDEVHHGHRDKIQEQILSLQKKLPKNACCSIEQT